MGGNIRRLWRRQAGSLGSRVDGDSGPILQDRSGIPIDPGTQTPGPPPPKATYVSFVLSHCFRAGGLDFEYDLVWHRIVQEKLATPPDKVALRRYMPLKAPPPAALAGYAFQIGSPVGLRPAGEPHLMSSMLVSNREPWVRKPNTVGVRSQSRWFQTQNRRLTNQTQSRRFSNPRPSVVK